jgi:hypothetical protein
MKTNETMTNDQLLKLIVKNCPNAILLHGLDDCIVAVHIGLPNRTNVLYSRGKIIDVLMKRDEMSYQDAIEFFDFNIAGLQFDKSITPYFVDDMVFNFSLN